MEKLTKICTKCNCEKELTEFRLVKKTQKYRSECKICHSIYAKNRLINNQNEIRVKAAESRTKMRRTKRGVIARIYDSQKTSSKNRNHNPPTYTLEWLIHFIMTNENFNVMYENWVKSGYKRNLIPSIDRKNDYIGYTEDNIKLVVFEDNRNRYYHDAKNGINNKQNKKIIQLTKDGIEINTFFSISEASRKTGTDHGDICKVAKGNKKTAGGFVWRYFIENI